MSHVTGYSGKQQNQSLFRILVHEQKEEVDILQRMNEFVLFCGRQMLIDVNTLICQEKIIDYLILNRWSKKKNHSGHAGTVSVLWNDAEIYVYRIDNFPDLSPVCLKLPVLHKTSLCLVEKKRRNY